MRRTECELTTETVLPSAEATADAVAGEQPTQVEAPEGEQTEKAEDEAKEVKPEKHPLEKELAKERRRNQALIRRVHAAEEAAKQINSRQPLQQRAIDDTNREDSADSEVVSLPKARLNEWIEERAREIAPTISSKAAEQERLTKAVAVLQEEFGSEFQELTDDLALVFDGNKQLAVLRTDAPAELVRYLTDPENSAEAERIAKMDDFDAGRAIARLEDRLKAKRAEAKPKVSKVPAPIEAGRGQGAVATGYHPNMTDAQYAAWRKSQRG